ncbi:MAG: lysophospholipid acyltransferase family protein [Dongiaceae bacterium]
MKGALSWLSERRLVHRLLAGYIWLVFRTTRWRWVGFEAIDRWAAGGEAGIFCFWHNRMVMMAYARRSRRTHHIIISPHRDGRFIASVVGFFGIRPIYASSSRNGVEGFRRAYNALAAGEMICITPDGPRGPRMRVGPGPIELARRAGVPLLPGTYGTRRRRTFGSWDRFILPLPFGRGVMVAGELLRVASAIPPSARRRAPSWSVGWWRSRRPTG